MNKQMKYPKKIVENRKNTNKFFKILKELRIDDIGLLQIDDFKDILSSIFKNDTNIGRDSGE